MTSQRATAIALVLIDLQEDYLAAPALAPSRTHVVAQAAELLQVFRDHGAPVAHVRTIVAPSENNAMPHRRERPLCVAGTLGSQAPSDVAEQPNELIVTKQFYSAFADGVLDSWLRVNGVGRVVVVGLYTHACVRQAATEAYERGYEVHVVLDACASNSAAHAEESISWMSQRFVTLSTTPDVSRDLTDCASAGSDDVGANVSVAVTRAVAAQKNWSQLSLVERRALVGTWRQVLVTHRESLAKSIMADVGKPLALARDEVSRAIAHVDSALAVFTSDRLQPEFVESHVVVSREPLGVVALIMPWNNPIALPVSNIAPGILAGNAVVFKPAPEAAVTSRLLLQTIVESGIPEDVVSVSGASREAGQALVAHPSISSVAVTGSIETGRAIARECASRFVPVRAELGGNNAVIVLADADLAEAARDLARNSFAFAGQRCTALRRAVVELSVVDEFARLIVNEVTQLDVTEPDLDGCMIGPMVSQSARNRVARQISQAIERGATLLVGGDPVTLRSGHGLTPAVVRCDDPHDAIVQTESFGPVLVLQPADSLEHAIELANGVEQGLVQAACTRNARALARIAAVADVGMFQVGARPLAVHESAAFIGRKSSGFGGAEHGKWDVDFYTRPRTEYRTR